MLLGGDKSGDTRWYKTSIPIAELRYEQYLERQRKEDRERTRRKKNENTR
jgi:hypothetical protein